MISITCPVCKNRFEVNDHLAGLSIFCKSCLTSVLVPAAPVGGITLVPASHLPPTVDHESQTDAVSPRPARTQEPLSPRERPSNPIPGHQVSAPSLSVEDMVEQLGGVRELFGPSIAGLVQWIVRGILATLFGLIFFGPLCLSVKQGGELTILAFLGPPVGALFLLLAGYFFYCLPSMLRYRFFFCPQGIVQLCGWDGKIVSCRWDDVASVTEGDFRRHPSLFARRLSYSMSRKDGQGAFVFDIGVNKLGQFRHLMREEVTRRGIPWDTVVYPPVHPLARTCPRCGTPSFTAVREVVMYHTMPGWPNIERSLRQCNECGMRYRAPTPAWAAILFIVLGSLLAGTGLIVIVALSTLYTRGDREPANIPLFIALVLGGVALLIYGIYTLLRRPSSEAPVLMVPAPPAAPPTSTSTPPPPPDSRFRASP